MKVKKAIRQIHLSELSKHHFGNVIKASWKEN